MEGGHLLGNAFPGQRGEEGVLHSGAPRGQASQCSLKSREAEAAAARPGLGPAVRGDPRAVLALEGFRTASPRPPLPSSGPSMRGAGSVQQPHGILWPGWGVGGGALWGPLPGAAVHRPGFCFVSGSLRCRHPSFSPKWGGGGVGWGTNKFLIWELVASFLRFVRRHIPMGGAKELGPFGEGASGPSPGPGHSHWPWAWGTGSRGLGRCDKQNTGQA